MNLVKYEFPPKPTKEEAQAAVDAFTVGDIEDCAWLIQTYLIDRGLDVPACYAPVISEFMEIWDDYDNVLDRDFREDWLERIMNVFRLTKGAIEKEIRRQHEKDAEIFLKIQNLMIANEPSNTSL